MNDLFINKLSGYLERDRKVLEKLQRQRQVLNRDNSINEALIRKCARKSFEPFIKLFKDRQMPSENTLNTMKRYYERKDEEKIFSLIFFYCVYFSCDLPDLLLVVASNKAALHVYFDEWLKKMSLSHEVA